MSPPAAPDDRGRGAPRSTVCDALPSASWCALCWLGSNSLLPYNVLLTCQPFFDEHAFKDMGFPFTSLLTFTLPLCVSQIVLIFRGEALALRARVGAGFAGLLACCAGLTLTSLAGGTWQRSSGVYALCLAFVAALGTATALLQTGILGAAGALGPESSAAVMVGLGGSGLLSLGLSLAVQAAERVAGGISEASGAAGMIVAAISFGFSFAYALISAWVFFSYLCRRDPRTAEAIARLEAQRSARAAEQRSGAPAPVAAPGGAQDCLVAEAADRAHGGAAGRSLQVLREVAPQAFNVAFTFIVTMCVFPGVVTQWVPGPESAFRDSRQLFGTLQVGVFQVFDTLSRAAGGCVARCSPPGRLWAPTVARVAFVPLFVLGQVSPSTCALWGSDAGRFCLSAGLAFTGGVTASCAMMFGPLRVAEEKREAAGMAMSCVMVVGIFLGTLLAPLTQLGARGGAAA